jgi:hypothetical protein
MPIMQAEVPEPDNIYVPQNAYSLPSLCVRMSGTFPSSH